MLQQSVSGLCQRRQTSVFSSARVQASIAPCLRNWIGYGRPSRFVTRLQSSAGVASMKSSAGGANGGRPVRIGVAWRVRRALVHVVSGFSAYQAHLLKRLEETARYDFGAGISPFNWSA